jgi:hypothetical protein
MDATVFWVVSACVCLVVGVYFFFVRARQAENPPTETHSQQ